MDEDHFQVYLLMPSLYPAAEEVVHARIVIAFFVWVWPLGFYAEDVPLGEKVGEP